MASSRDVDVLRQMEGLTPYTGPSEDQLAAVRSANVAASATAATATATAATAAPLAGPDNWAEVAGLAAVDADQADSGIAPGWYPDPLKKAGLRWWDGRAWSGFTSD